MSFKIKTTEHFNSAQMVFGASGATYNGSAYEYMNIPKPKFSFVVHLELSVAALELIRNIHGSSAPLGKMTSFLVKDVQLPGFTMDTISMNQYNRTRLHQGKITYDPVDLNIYDTVGSAGLLLLDAYRTFYYGDFSDKSFESWRYDSISSAKNFEYTFPLTRFIKGAVENMKDTDYTWGRSVYNQGDQDQGY